MHLRATWDWDTQGYNGMTFGASLKWTLEEVQLPKILTCQTMNACKGSLGFTFKGTKTIFS